jgi:hypothetical protein
MRSVREFSDAPIPNWETIRTHHEGTKNTKGLANILLNFVTFVVSPLFFAR